MSLWKKTAEALCLSHYEEHRRIYSSPGPHGELKQTIGRENADVSVPYRKQQNLYSSAERCISPNGETTEATVLKNVDVLVSPNGETTETTVLQNVDVSV